MYLLFPSNWPAAQLRPLMNRERTKMRGGGRACRGPKGSLSFSFSFLLGLKMLYKQTIMPLTSFFKKRIKQKNACVTGMDHCWTYGTLIALLHKWDPATENGNKGKGWVRLLRRTGGWVKAALERTTGKLEQDGSSASAGETDNSCLLWLLA